MAEFVELLRFIALKSLSRRLSYKALNKKAACLVRFLRVYSVYLPSSSVVSNWRALEMPLGGACS